MSDNLSVEAIERWTAKRRAALVLSILKGETSVTKAARRHGLMVARVEDWSDRFLVRAENTYPHGDPHGGWTTGEVVDDRRGIHAGVSRH